MAVYKSREMTLYTLSDPRDGVVRYVGCTSNLARRMWGHRSSKYPNMVSIWVRELLDEGINPSVDILEVVDYEIAGQREKFYISKFSENLCLLNMIDGGGGISPGRITGEKNPMYGVRLCGDKNSFFGRQHSDVTKELLRQKCGHVGDDPVWNKGKTGIYSEELISKMKENQPNRRGIIVTDMNGNVLHKFISKRECCIELKMDRGQLDYVMHKKKRGNVYKGMKFYYE